MMKYKVLKFFMDGQDGNHSYIPGNIYPREGLTPSAERIAELASTKNRLGEILIEPLVQSTAQKKEEEKPAEIIEEQAAKPKKKKKSE